MLSTNNRQNFTCPRCGLRQSYVLDKRTTGDGAVTRRRRECPDCGQRFTTYERVAAEADEATVLRVNAVDLADGYYWWRKDGTESWVLAEVLHRNGRFVARFFNGMNITDRPWGEWMRVELAIPA